MKADKISDFKLLKIFYFFINDTEYLNLHNKNNIIIFRVSLAGEAIVKTHYIR